MSFRRGGLLDLSAVHELVDPIRRDALRVEAEVATSKLESLARGEWIPRTPIVCRRFRGSKLFDFIWGGGGGRAIELVGLLFDPSSWNGSDLFMPRGRTRRLVTSRVAQLLRGAGVTNLRLGRIVENRRLEWRG